MNLTTQIQNFTEHLTVIRGLSKNTVESYTRDLTLFAKTTFAKSPILIEEDNIREYLKNLATGRITKDNKPASIATQARHISALRQFFLFLLEEHQIRQNPMANIEMPKKGASLPKAITQEQAKSLLNCLKRTDAKATRERLILQLLYGCGLRVSELTHLKASDVINEDQRFLRITGKGDKTRIVPIGNAVTETLNIYLKNYRPQFNKYGSEWLFPSTYKPKNATKPKPMSRVQIWNIIKDLGKQAGMENLSPHTLRHTFATHMVENDADLRAVQLMLGHSDLATTQIYTKVTDKRIKQVLENQHPLSKATTKS